MLRLLPLLVILVALPAQGQNVYRWVDADGVVTYQDRPPPPEAREPRDLTREPGAVYRTETPNGGPAFQDYRERDGVVVAPPPARPTTAPRPAPTTTHAAATPQAAIAQQAVHGPTLAIIRPLAYPLAAMLFLMGFGLAFKARFKGWVGEASVALHLKQYGFEAQHDLILQEPDGGLTQLDHVVRTPRGLTVVETKNYSGLIFGSAHEARWTQRIGQQSHSFQNPLRQNYRHVEALRSAVGEVPVRGLVVFTGDARFPKGIPEGVVTLRELGEQLTAEPGPDADHAQLDRAWSRLTRLSRNDKRTRTAHLDQLRSRFGRDNSVPAGYLLMGIGALIALLA